MVSARKGGHERPPDLSPDDIRRIRDKLGLSQVEAGELLGGGPRAFTKYESGTIKPAASVANILRLLDANPSAIITLSGGKVVPIENDGARPFEVTGRHVSALSSRKLMLLTRRLLDAEALSGDLPMDGIHVAAVITATDGGEDARIEWADGPARTRYLPARLSQFQLKAGEISPSGAGADVLTDDGGVKPMVREVLERGGTYIMLCGHSYTNDRIKARADGIRKSIAKGGMSIAPAQVQFRDADQIAAWVNIHPPVAAWVLEQTQPGMVGPFKDWTHWSGRYDNTPWVTDPRLPEFRDQLRSMIGVPRGIARVVGLSGIGKSRLVHEALGPTDQEEGSAPRLCDLALYAVEPEAGAIAVKNIVQSLADSGFRAVAVVDRCTAETHQDLSGMIKRASSRISLITIDHEVPPDGHRADDTLVVGLAAEAVIDGMIKNIAPDLPSEDHRRLLKFARGFPQIANLLGQAWLKDASLAHATDDDLFDRIILGRKASDPALIKDAGMLLGAFRLLGIKEPLKDLEHVAAFSRGRSVDDLRAALDELLQRGVVQQHGRLASLQPKPLAMALAERQWRQWGESRWDAILAGSLPIELRDRAADQLALLNTRPIATEVARHVLRLNGPLASLVSFRDHGNGGIVSSLSEIDAGAAVTLLEKIIKPLSIDQLKEVDGDARRHMVRALEKIAFLEDTFERAALLLLTLAVAENETWGNNSVGQFKALFPVFLSDTEAGAEPRLRLLDELIAENDPKRMPLVVEALLAGSNMHSHSRMVGAEIHGSRPALESWHPKYWKDAWDYVIACVDRLSDLALRQDAIGAQARTAMAHDFRTLASGGLIEHVERWVKKIQAVHRYWPEALNALGDVLQYDLAGLKEGEEARIRALIAELNPDDLHTRVRFLVSEMPWDFPIDEKLEFADRGKRQVEAVEELAREFLRAPKELAEVLPQLSRGQQRMALAFGTAIAKFSEDPLHWLSPIKDAAQSAPPDQRNFGLLAGYVTGLAERDRSAAEAFKREAAASTVFAPALPIICMHVGISEADVSLACGALKKGFIPPGAMAYWSFGGVLAKLPTRAVTPLFDLMLQMNGDAYSVALDLMGMFVHDQASRLEEMRPQLLLAVKNIGYRPKRHGSQMDAHHFERMVGWLLAKGREDADARAVAGGLAKHLVADPDGNARDLIKPLLPKMLSEFASIVWPVFGQAIVGDRAKAWRIEHALGDSFTFADEKNPALLKVPEDILFAWCHAYPDAAPRFVATTAPVLTTRNPNVGQRDFHPLVKRLLDEFGDREDVLRGLVQNMHTFGWSGSRTTYYALYEQPLRSLEAHPIGAVRRWAKIMLAQMRKEIESAQIEDDERKAQWDT